MAFTGLRNKTPMQTGDLMSRRLQGQTMNNEDSLIPFDYRFFINRNLCAYNFRQTTYLLRVYLLFLSSQFTSDPN